METNFTYNDERQGDTYVIHMLGTRFCYALRYIGRVGRDPIYYDNIDSLPDSVRPAIKEEIAERR